MMRRTRDALRTATEHGVRTDSVSVIQGVRRDGSAPVSPRDVRDALTVAYPQLVFTGWTAAALHGAQFTDGHPPEIWLPQQRTRSGVIIRCGALAPEDIEIVLRRRATSGVLTAVDIARRTAGDEAIAGFDQCLRPDRYGRSVTTAGAVLAYLDARPSLHAGRRVRQVLAESSDAADSHWETYTRLVVHRAGFAFFRPQVGIPGTRYRVDLGSERYRIAIEYDGGYHRSVAQQRRDVARWNAITGRGWAIIRVTAWTLAHDRATFVLRLENELRARGWSGPRPVLPRLALPPSSAVSVGESQVAITETAGNVRPA